MSVATSFTIGRIERAMVELVQAIGELAPMMHKLNDLSDLVTQSTFLENRVLPPEVRRTELLRLGHLLAQVQLPDPEVVDAVAEAVGRLKTARSELARLADELKAGIGLMKE